MNAFKRSGFEIFFGRHSDKLIFVFLVVYGLVETFHSLTPNFPRVAIYAGIPCLLFIWLLANIGFWRFAYKIVFDEESGEVTFYMFRSKDIKVRITSISKIVMGVTLNFHLDGKVVKYHGYDDSRLMEYIDNNNYIIPVEYNKLGHIFSGRKGHDKT